MIASRFLSFASALLVTSAGRAQDPASPRPLAPGEALRSIRVPEGFRVDLVAAEPDVIDPVALAFDEQGRL